jgi:T-complex protein 1 subunit delta
MVIFRSKITYFSNQGAVTNILEEEVVQPLLVSTSAITLATETVRSILKIDDIVNTMQ